MRTTWKLVLFRLLILFLFFFPDYTAVSARHVSVRSVRCIVPIDASYRVGMYYFPFALEILATAVLYNLFCRKCLYSRWVYKYTVYNVLYNTGRWSWKHFHFYTGMGLYYCISSCWDKRNCEFQKKSPNIVSTSDRGSSYVHAAMCSARAYTNELILWVLTRVLRTRDAAAFPARRRRQKRIAAGSYARVAVES